MPASTSATAAATITRPRTVLTVVLGSVTMKKMNSWYIGPVSGAISATSGPPLIELRSRGHAQRRDEPVVATQDAVARFAQHEDERDQEGNRVAGIEPAQPGPRRPDGGHAMAPAR